METLTLNGSVNKEGDVSRNEVDTRHYKKVSFVLRDTVLICVADDAGGKDTDHDVTNGNWKSIGDSPLLLRAVPKEAHVALGRKAG